MKITNKHNLPEPVVRALSQDHYTRGASHRSMTQLIDSPRQQILNRAHSEDITEDCVDRLWSVFGTAVHNIFERYGDEESVVEERLFVDVEGWTISGAIDLQEKGVIKDYKVTSVWSVIYDKPEWHEQLNAYAWLVEKAKGIDVKALNIVAVLRDWKQREAELKGKEYPQSPIVVIDIPLWSVEERESYMMNRISLHQQAEMDYLMGDEMPHCTDKERWLKPSTYAVKKPKNKRADRVFDSLEEAEVFVSNKSGLVIEERKSEPTRCMRYCHASQFCTQHQEFLNGQ